MSVKKYKALLIINFNRYWIHFYITPFTKKYFTFLIFLFCHFLKYLPWYQFIIFTFMDSTFKLILNTGIDCLFIFLNILLIKILPHETSKVASISSPQNGQVIGILLNEVNIRFFHFRSSLLILNFSLEIT